MRHIDKDYFSILILMGEMLISRYYRVSKKSKVRMRNFNIISTQLNIILSEIILPKHVPVIL